MKQKIDLIVDGEPAAVDADPAMPPLSALRWALGLDNPEFDYGKAHGDARTVHVGGTPERTCVKPVRRLGVKEAWTWGQAFTL